MGPRLSRSLRRRFFLLWAGVTDGRHMAASAALTLPLETLDAIARAFASLFSDRSDVLLDAIDTISKRVMSEVPISFQSCERFS